jgi:hypothetical protein
LGSDHPGSRLIVYRRIAAMDTNRGAEVVNTGFWLLTVVSCLLYVALVRDIDREVRDL